MPDLPTTSASPQTALIPVKADLLSWRPWAGAMIGCALGAIIGPFTSMLAIPVGLVLMVICEWRMLELLWKEKEQEDGNPDPR